MKKKCQVVMLPNKKATKLMILSTLSTGYESMGWFDTLVYSSSKNTSAKHYRYQHLYITSNEEIKEGDWYCSPSGIISQHNGTEVLPDGWNKVIATTDNSLKIINHNDTWDESDDEQLSPGLIIKLDKSNQITITRVKESWSRNEVENLLRKIYFDATGKMTGIGFVPNWIKQNL